MIIESDRAIADENRLEICKRCGWYASRYTHNNCRPDRGRVAATLARELPEAHPTKLGYGEGCVTFVLDEETSVRFEIGHDNSIKLREVYALQDLTINDAADIVRALRKALGK